MKKTLYGILGVRPNASDPEINEAYRKLSEHFRSGDHGLDPAEATLQLNLVEQAYWTLSDNMRRAAYDASLTATLIPAPEVRVERVRSSPRLVPPRVILSVIGGLLVVGVLIQIMFSMAYRGATGETRANLAQKKTALKEYEQTYGVSSPAEIGAMELRQKEEKERRQAELKERQRAQSEREEARELAEQRRYADRVSRDLRWEEEREQERTERERARAEEEERMRAENEKQRAEEQRRKWRMQLER